MFSVQRLIPIICLIAALLLIGSEFLDTFVIENPEGVAVATVDAGDRHGYALALLGLLAIAATLVAVLAGSRPAAFAVAVCGVAALALLAAIDLPDVGARDLIADPNRDFTEGLTVTDSGFWVALGASLLMIIAGVLLATLSAAQLRALRPGSFPRRSSRVRSSGADR